MTDKQPRKKPVPYTHATEAFKAIVAALAKKTDARTAAEAYGVSIPTVRRWTKALA